MGFTKRSQVPSHASLCERCSLSPSSAKEAVPIWREVFILSFRDRFSHHCSEKTCLDPTDRYDGDAQMRKISVGALDRGAALRLFPFASSFAVLKRIEFALVTVFMSNHSRAYSRSVSPMSTT